MYARKQNILSTILQIIKYKSLNTTKKIMGFFCLLKLQWKYQCWYGIIL